MVKVEFATVLPGATAFNEGNVNETFRGQVLLKDMSVRAAIIKDLDLIQLCNELLASTLARIIGLPVPDCFIGLASPAVLAAQKAPVFQNGSRLVFVSSDVKVPNITFQLRGASAVGQHLIMQELAKWADLGRLYAFDAWIANIDRHPGNLLLGNPGDIWIIDHGHCFTGSAWSPPDLNPSTEFPNRLSQWVTPCLSSAQREARRKQVFALEAAVKNFDAKPASDASWLPDLLPAERVSALQAFIEARSVIFAKHASNALGLPVMV